LFTKIVMLALSRWCHHCPRHRCQERGSVWPRSC